MTRKTTPPEDRPMPPPPASGGAWEFDPVAWAYVPAGSAPTVEAPVEPARKEG